MHIVIFYKRYKVIMDQNSNYEIQFPTSTVAQMRLCIFDPITYRPDSNKKEYYHQIKKNDYGRVELSVVRLTQVHAIVLETIFNHYLFKTCLSEQGCALARAQFETATLLKQLGWHNSSKHYTLLNEILNDLNTAHVKYFPKCPSEKLDYEDFIDFSILVGHKMRSYTKTNNQLHEILVSPYFLELLEQDTWVRYPQLTIKIGKINNGIIQSIVRFLLSQSLNLHTSYEGSKVLGWKGTLDKLLELMCVTTKHINSSTGNLYTSALISKVKRELKPIYDPKQDAWVPSELTNYLDDNFGIKLTWTTARNCNVEYNKTKFEKNFKLGLPVKFTNAKNTNIHNFVSNMKAMEKTASKIEEPKKEKPKLQRREIRIRSKEELKPDNSIYDEFD